MRHLILAGVLLTVSAFLPGHALAQAPAPPSPPAPAPVIHLPDGPIAPPTPAMPIQLNASVLYVIDADCPCIVLTSPRGLVSVTTESGPLRIRGQFVDGIPGKTETRTYKRANIYCLDPVATGLVEVLVIPAGSADSKSVIRRLINVEANPAPPPLPLPPGPPGPPVPPPGPVDPLIINLSSIYASETDPDKGTNLPLLAAFYKHAADVVVNDPGVKTYGDLFAALAAARKAVMADTVLPNLRKAVGEQLNKDLPADGGTAVDRAAAAKAFKHVATALAGVK